ncbi:nicotinate-nucleotide adenylyltransferase [Alteribacter lacisalsi]|uniref:Probable nicotinate-nucleotide adenylyltransferase n=1 Tax=Alteribacter lacisalsi TaxID=2045244 RepID=A0A2W0HA33_9BACI|nr:nicotinate-nucleotide adenylyltransferase [Alteribacter lacisalsi]PYZ98714.1 nicotinate-nucleotide adenylyltransferase [Alteribacter lacisalsi]
MGKRVGILGGTFDPPHLGHAVLAETAYLSLSLDEVWWMPNRLPPHKEKKSCTTGRDRLEMVSRVCALRPYFKLNTAEFDREGPSYTVDTLEQFHELFPDHTFYFIIGGDSIESLEEWYRIDRICELVTFTGMRRPGYRSRPDWKYPVSLLEGPEFDVSSTGIREMVKNKQFHSFLVPEPVMAYMKEHRLYE